MSEQKPEYITVSDISGTVVYQTPTITTGDTTIQQIPGFTPPYPFEYVLDGNSYAKISPNDLESIRMMIREEVRKALAEVPQNKFVNTGNLTCGYCGTKATVMCQCCGNSSSWVDGEVPHE